MRCLREFMEKPLAPHKAGAASEILLLGACELLILKVAPHAAVDAANQLAAKDTKAVHFKPLINAVLRKIAKEGEAVLSGLDRERLSTPDWLWTRWTAQYGAGTARLIARAHQHAAPVDIVLKSPDGASPDSEALFGTVRRLSDRPDRRPARLCRRRLVGAGCRRHLARAAAGRCRGQDV